ncbi:MAG TPA: inositol monophosphatase family protein [Blastocatellia bacterium]|nr:inositol monophosphatase family protein [Blastocatellia bacterium]
MLELAIRAAREAGAIIQDFAARRFDIIHKGRINLVTEADLASEQHIKALIAAAYPAHRIIAEESGISHHEEADYCWIIDPLDGTTNFAHGLPCYSVSIGLEHKGEMIAGVIYDPSHEELFVVERGAGAMLNGEKIRVSEVADLEKALLVTGFPYDVRERLSFYMPAWEAFLCQAQGVRRLGSAAIDLAYVACGRLDGFWEWGLNPWDCAAGWLLIEEAGGKLTKTDGSAFDMTKPDMLATNAVLHEQMVAVLNDAKLRM